MDDSFKLAEQMFGRCQTCTQNMVKSICALTCAPNQNQFLNVTDKKEMSNGKFYATSLDFRIDYEYMKGTYDSCAGVISPATGTRVMGIACGGNTADTCNPTKWYEYMGNPAENIFTPFKITYNQTEDSDNRFEYTVKPCNESYDGHYACSCVDCKLSCPAGIEPKLPEPVFQVGPFNGPAFIIAMILGAVSFAFVIYGVSCGRNRNSSECSCGGFPAIDIMFTKFFTKWGQFVANHPVIILMLFSWTIIGLGYGASKLIIITDPVELWAAPQSRSRLEKDYFDSRFGPFYRTEQIFIKPKDQSKVS